MTDVRKIRGGNFSGNVSQALHLTSDLVPGWMGDQSSGLTHWNPVKRQWNLTLSGEYYVMISPSHKWLGSGSLNLISPRLCTGNAFGSKESGADTWNRWVNRVGERWGTSNPHTSPLE